MYSKYCNDAKLLLELDDDVLWQPQALSPLTDNIRTWMKSPTPLYIGTVSYEEDIVNIAYSDKPPPPPSLDHIFTRESLFKSKPCH